MASSSYSRKLNVTRTNTGLGSALVINAGEVVRMGHVFPEMEERGSLKWFAWVADYYGPGAPPVLSRIPESGGYRTMDDLEAEMCGELLRPRF